MKNALLVMLMVLSSNLYAIGSAPRGGIYEYDSDGNVTRSVTDHGDGDIRDSDDTGMVYNPDDPIPTYDDSSNGDD